MEAWEDYELEPAVREEPLLVALPIIREEAALAATAVATSLVAPLAAVAVAQERLRVAQALEAVP